MTSVPKEVPQQSFYLIVLYNKLTETNTLTIKNDPYTRGRSNSKEFVILIDISLVFRSTPMAVRPELIFFPYTKFR